MMKLKSNKSDLKILLALGGWNAGAGNYNTSIIKISFLKLFEKSMVETKADFFK